MTTSVTERQEFVNSRASDLEKMKKFQKYEPSATARVKLSEQIAFMEGWLTKMRAPGALEELPETTFQRFKSIFATPSEKQEQTKKTLASRVSLSPSTSSITERPKITLVNPETITPVETLQKTEKVREKLSPSPSNFALSNACGIQKASLHKPIPPPVSVMTN